MTPAMAKKAKTPSGGHEQPQDDGGDWKLFATVDGSLKPLMEAYIDSLEYKVNQSRVIERALREFLASKGFPKSAK